MAVAVAVAVACPVAATGLPTAAVTDVVTVAEALTTSPAVTVGSVVAGGVSRTGPVGQSGPGVAGTGLPGGQVPALTQGSMTRRASRQLPARPSAPRIPATSQTCRRPSAQYGIAADAAKARPGSGSPNEVRSTGFSCSTCQEPGDVSMTKRP
ncbi:unannotated protein [freshwater metagenome]|uniref:Unannotated protein n=1 Tax=freshwater metagenome TaxID=449393 RepID=A0A6J7K0B5_9ZZZZ